MSLQDQNPKPSKESHDYSTSAMRTVILNVFLSIAWLKGLSACTD